MPAAPALDIILALCSGCDDGPRCANNWLICAMHNHPRRISFGIRTSMERAERQPMSVQMDDTALSASVTFDSPISDPQTAATAADVKGTKDHLLATKVAEAFALRMRRWAKRKDSLVAGRAIFGGSISTPNYFLSAPYTEIMTSTPPKNILWLYQHGRTFRRSQPLDVPMYRANSSVNKHVYRRSVGPSFVDVFLHTKESVSRLSSTFFTNDAKPPEDDDFLVGSSHNF